MNLATGRGWGFPAQNRKAHYFINGFSLCGHWLYWGRNLGEAAAPGPDDCKTCWKILGAAK